MTGTMMRTVKNMSEFDDDTVIPLKGDVKEHFRKFLESKSQETDEYDDGERPVCSCGTETKYAASIGPYCPNDECEILDGPFE